MDRFKVFDKLDTISQQELLCYEEVSEIPENEGDYESSVSYVKDKRDGKLYIKKELKNCDKSVYQALLDYEEFNEKKLPGVPQIKTLAGAGNTVYVIEEFINCPTLHSVMRSEAITVDELIHIFREVCIVLEKLHKSKKPISHGDISEYNILVDMDAIRGKTKNQKVYLVDFNRGEKFLLKADISEDIKRTCKTLRDCMDTLILKSITEYDGQLWNSLRAIAENGEFKYTTDRQMMLELGKLIGKRAPRTEKRKKKKYTLPGYRTKKVWKATIATIAYIFMITVVVVFDVDRDGLWTLYERACVFGIMFSYVAWFTNYMGVRDKYSWLTGKNVAKKLIGHFVAVVAIFGFWMMMMIGPDLLGLF